MLALVVALCACALLSPAAFALDDEVSWASLSAQQKRVLQRLEPRWDEFDLHKRQALARGAARWQSMTPQQKKRARKRFAWWAQLPEARRDRIRAFHRQWQDLTPQEKIQIRKNFRRFRSLPPARQKELRERFRKMTPEQRRQRMTTPPRARR